MAEACGGALERWIVAGPSQAEAPAVLLAASRAFRMTKAAALSRGSLLLPHFGLWMQEGQPALHRHSSIV
ncbi:MAG TPA: hypothetical protein VMW58_15620, partial [Anaerolineae bacterium]|nr:hypothetical protein [Anaerolineae bacterium]